MINVLDVSFKAQQPGRAGFFLCLILGAPMRVI